MKKYPTYNIQQFSNETHTSDFYINEFNQHIQSHSFINKPHSHDFYLLVIFKKGKGFHFIDFETHEIADQTLFILTPGQVHNWNFTSPIEGYIVFISRNFYNQYYNAKKIESYPFFDTFHQVPHLTIQENNFDEVYNYFEKLYSENQSQKILKNDKILNLIDSLLIDLTRFLDTDTKSTPSVSSQRIQQFFQLVEQHFVAQKKPSFYANTLNISLKQLNRNCKELFNKTATSIIKERIILESKRLLSQQKHSVKEISNALGFENYSYFSKVFKSETGVSPKEFSGKNS